MVNKVGKSTIIYLHSLHNCENKFLASIPPADGYFIFIHNIYELLEYEHKHVTLDKIQNHSAS